MVNFLLSHFSGVLTPHCAKVIMKTAYLMIGCWMLRAKLLQDVSRIRDYVLPNSCMEIWSKEHVPKSVQILKLM